jgi:small conductance mechanosensitive channel
MSQAATEAAKTGGDNTLPIVLALAVAALLSAILSIVAGGLMRRLLASIDRDRPRAHAVSMAAVRLARLLGFAVGLVVLATPALELAGVQSSLAPGEEIGRWAARVGLRIAVILLGAFAINQLIGTLVQRAEDEIQSEAGLPMQAARQRARTLAASLRAILSVFVWFVALLMVLRQMDVDVTPILTGAGILGLAVGFGAQTLVRDVISGFFLIIEDQVRVGDVAVVNGVGGTVEQINLRTTVLRDSEGTVHVFPNGAITTLANRTRDFAYYVIDLPMDYGDDTDTVVAAAREAADDLRADPAWAKDVLEPLEVLGIDAFASSQVTLKIRIRTVPGRQWDVGRELRRRIKKVFDLRGIRMPFAQMTVYVRQDGKPGESEPPTGDRP